MGRDAGGQEAGGRRRERRGGAVAVAAGGLGSDGSTNDDVVGRVIGAEVVIAALVACVLIAGALGWMTRASTGSSNAVAVDGVTPPTAAIGAYAGHHSATYADPTHWVCRPDRDDVCDRDLDTTVLAADGSTTVEPFVADPAAPIDCFYVYPTVSRDRGRNSDLIPSGDQELEAAHRHAARFGSQCRVFAPVYRQRTMTDLVGGAERAKPSASASESSTFDIAYADALDAFQHYIANDNEGRGFVLIGEGQGASMLWTLIQREIVGDADLRSHLVSALLIGFPTAVDPVDPDAFPACRRPGQLGCIVSYASFREAKPPPANAAYGRTRVCTNPAALAGGSSALHPYFATDRHVPFVDPGQSGKPPPWVDPSRGVVIRTPFVSTPGLLTAQCATHGPFTTLDVTVHGDRSDPRTDDITGDLAPSWGLHMVDFDLAMGDLLDVVARQRDAYGSR